MFRKTRVVVLVVFISVIQQMFLINGQTIPTENNDKRGRRHNPTTSYYQPNVFGANSYAFGFEVNDKATGNIQFRDERRFANGTTHGSYGYVRPDGSVMITHYFADDELGYLSQSQNFGPGEEPVWHANWPTKKPEKSTEIPDDKDKVNLTSILLPVEPVKGKHDIDLNPPALEKELLNPAVLQIINGDVPLISDTQKKGSSIGVETINKFIPPEFPIVPFELPSDELRINLREGFSEKPIPVLNKTTTDKSDTSNSTNSPKLPKQKSLENSSNTTLAKQTSKKNGLSNNNSTSFPKADSIITDNGFDWYDKVINRTRQEYLEAVQ